MLVRWVAGILDRDLRTLRREVEAYPLEAQLWQQVPGMPNTAGTLVLHLTGNVRFYVGSKLGGTGYARDRAAEFARRDVPRGELLEGIEAARTELAGTFARLDDDALPPEYPEVITGMRVATDEYLMHLLTHFAYHLGQVDTHRRLVTGDSLSAGAVRPAELSSARPAKI
ncbi:MAG: DinB family protein [Gemmatimonadales bacterium]